MKKIVFVLLITFLLLGGALSCSSSASTTTSSPTTSAAPPTTTSAPPTTTSSVAPTQTTTAPTTSAPQPTTTTPTTTIAPTTTTTTASLPTIKWKIETFTPNQSPIGSQFLGAFIKAMSDNTGGKFTFQLYDPDTVVPSNTISQAVVSDVLQAGFTSPSYDVGSIPEAAVAAGIPFAFDTATQCLDFWYKYQDGAAMKLLTSSYEAKGMHPVQIAALDDPMAIMTMFPPNRLSDFKGKKIRITGAHAAGITAMGGQPFFIGLGDVYNALQSHLADGVFMATSGLDTFKWNQVVKYVSLPYWMFGSPMMLEVNLTEWNKLPPEYQKIFTDTALNVNYNTTIPNTINNPATTRKTAEAMGVQWISMPASDVVTYKQELKVLWTDKEQASDTSAKIFQLIRDYMPTIGLTPP